MGYKTPMFQCKRSYIVLLAMFFVATLFTTRTFSSTGMFLEDEGGEMSAIIEKTIAFLKERKPSIPDDR